VENKLRASNGWGKTKRGISKRCHYFIDARSVCTGAAPAEGPLATVAEATADEICPECIARLAARSRSNRRRSKQTEDF
jgi:hypothetical protein